MVGAWKLHCENQSLLLITLTGWCRLSSNSDGRVTMWLMFQVPSTLALIHILSTSLITIKYSRYARTRLKVIRKLTYFPTRSVPMENSSSQLRHWILIPCCTTSEFQALLAVDISNKTSLAGTLKASCCNDSLTSPVPVEIYKPRSCKWLVIRGRNVNRGSELIRKIFYGWRVNLPMPGHKGTLR